MPPKLTTTSYALLGLLDRRPFSAYDLTGYMRRGALRSLWPRTEASIYREPKILESHGLARSTVEHTGARRRTVYEITPAGRRALRAWLEEPAERFRFECEGALKVVFADAMSLDCLRGHLERIAGQPLTGTEPDPTVLDDLLEGRGAFPDRVHLAAITSDLVGRVNIAMREWAAHWLDNIDEWSTTTLDATSERQAREELLGLQQRVRAHMKRARRRASARQLAQPHSVGPTPRRCR